MANLNNSQSDKKHVTVHDICMSFDDAYVLPALITLKSLKSNSTIVFNLTLINMNSTLSTSSEHLVSNWCSRNNIILTIIPVNVESSQIHVDERITIASYGRIYAISSLKKPFIYLDSDVLALRNWDSIFLELNSLVLGEKTILASLEPNIRRLTTSNMARRLTQDEYFNSGVLGINPKLIDSTGLIVKVMSLTKKYEEYNLWAHDQDLLNIIFMGEVVALSSVYNTNIWRKTESKPCILHFDGFFKPWKISGLALVGTLIIAALFDLRDIGNHGPRFFRFRGFIRHKLTEKFVRAELKEIFTVDGKEVNYKNYLTKFKRLTITDLVQHLFMRFTGSTKATI